MINILSKFKIALFLVLAVPHLVYANYTITPVKIQIKPGSMMSSLTVHNNNDATRYFQVRVYLIDKTNNAELETRDVISSPSMFKSNPKKSQIVRIAIKNPEEAFKNKNYVLSIKELPHGEIENNTVKFVTDFRVPLLIGDAEQENGDQNEQKTDKK